MSAEKNHDARAKRYIRTCLTIIVLALLPIACAMLAMLVANLLGCSISASGPRPCYVLGADIGEILCILVTMHWLALISVPAGAVMLAIVTVATAVSNAWQDRPRSMQRPTQRADDD